MWLHPILPCDTSCPSPLARLCLTFLCSAAGVWSVLTSRLANWVGEC